MRRLGMTRVFGNPGSTEIPFLTDFPDDLEFVLGLHEGAVVGMASGYALGTGRPAFVNLHTAAGLGNAVNAIVCARDNRVPLVIVVGQQDRRQLALGPFLTGRNLERLAGDYPVSTTQPAHAARGARGHRPRLARGDRAPRPRARRRSDGGLGGAARRRVGRSGCPPRLLTSSAVDAAPVDELAALFAAASSPALVVGAGADTPEGWSAVVALAERLECPVWQDTFSSRHGFPAGSSRCSPATCRGGAASCGSCSRATTSCSRSARRPSGSTSTTPARWSRRRRASPSWATIPTTCCAVRAISRCWLARQRSAPQLAAVSRSAAERSPAASSAPRPRRRPSPGEPLAPAHVIAALAAGLPEDAILVEEAPSNRPEILGPHRDARTARLRRRRQRRARLRAGRRDRSADGAPRTARSRAARRRLVDVLDPGPLERGALRRRRRLRRDGKRALRRYG